MCGDLNHGPLLGRSQGGLERTTQPAFLGGRNGSHDRSATHLTWAALGRSQGGLERRNPRRLLTEAGHMTAPRRILPGASYIVARRCAQRRFYLTPTPQLVQDIKYVLACAAATFDIELHAAVFMSNHYHLWLTDTAGLLPKFMHTFNRNLARVVKAHYPEIEGEVFDHQPYNALMVLSHEAATAELAYVLANPVKAELVECHHQWPGLITTGDMLKEALAQGSFEETVPRPGYGLRTLPDAATLRIVPYRPHALRGEAERAEADRLMREILEGALAEVEAQEAAGIEARRSSGRKVLGLSGLARQSPLHRPRGIHDTRDEDTGLASLPTLAPSRYDAFRHIKPALVARCATLMRTAASALKTWRNAYRQARAQLQQGLKDICMPAGTWWLKAQRLAPCEVLPEGSDPVALCLQLV